MSCYNFIYNDSPLIPIENKFGFRQTRGCNFVVYRHINISNPRDPRPYGDILPKEDYDYRNKSSAIYRTFDPAGKGVDMWLACCEAAWKCCERMINTERRDQGSFCPRTWDGWHCFDDTNVGDFFESECPEYIYFNTEVQPCRELRRPCETPNKWPAAGYNLSIDSLYERTEYAVCSSVTYMERRQITHIVVYSVSLVALAPALVIFSSYKQLRVHRIKMHINFFSAIFFHGIVFIIFKFAVILRHLYTLPELPGCRFLYALTKYTRATTYMWMFCEGFYLHKLIVAAFAEQKSLLMYYLIGWGFPIIPVAVYSILRITDEAANEKCWGLFAAYEWVVNGPNLAALVFNILFLFNIIRVLVTKLKSTHTNEPNQYRKAVRATLVLVPLFGLHLVVTLYKYDGTSCTLSEVYTYTNFLLDGLQGFLVALVFCYLNGEVLTLLKRTFTQYKLQKKLDSNSRRMRDTYRQSVTSSHTNS